MTMKPLKTASDVIEHEEAMKTQPELDLVHTVTMPKGFLPKTICLMWVNQRQTRWIETQEPCRGFGCMDDSLVTVHRQRTEVMDPELSLATFDEKALKKHIEQWGTKTHERKSVHSGYGQERMDKFETWLTYTKIEFQQLEGVRMMADHRTIEIEETIAERVAKRTC